MAKLQDLFSQARRAQSSGGMGFLGKNRSESKPRAAALIVQFTNISAGSAEAALKAGADGLLFNWDGKDSSLFTTLKKEIASAKANKEELVAGLNITANSDKLDRESLVNIKGLDIQYIMLPFNAPARLLALETKELEKVVTVPMRKGEIYPLYIRNLGAFDDIAGISLDFGLTTKISSLTIEEVLDYRAVREAVRFPAFINVPGNLSEADAFTLSTLSIQAFVLTASQTDETTREQIKALNELLEKVHEEHKDKDSPSVPGNSRK